MNAHVGSALIQCSGIDLKGDGAFAPGSLPLGVAVIGALMLMSVLL